MDLKEYAQFAYGWAKSFFKYIWTVRQKKKHVYTDTKSLQRVITYLLLLEH